jgi:hypothetical protein
MRVILTEQLLAKKSQNKKMYRKKESGSAAMTPVTPLLTA